MDAGTIAEQGEPSELLRDPSSKLLATVNAMGTEAAAKLIAKANAASEARKGRKAGAAAEARQVL